jgi:uncharacterized membrane protein
MVILKFLIIVVASVIIYALFNDIHEDNNDDGSTKDYSY